MTNPMAIQEPRRAHLDTAAGNKKEPLTSALSPSEGEREMAARCAQPRRWDTAFGCRRDLLETRCVYTVVSSRARGLSVGVNMNPDKFCNFDCVYCEVNRAEPVRDTHLDVDVMAEELQATLALVRCGRIRERSNYQSLPIEVLQLGQVTLSGDVQPTLSPNFTEQ